MMPPANGAPVTDSPGSAAHVRSLAPIQHPSPGAPVVVPRQRAAAAASSSGLSSRARLAPADRDVCSKSHKLTTPRLILVGGLS